MRRWIFAMSVPAVLLILTGCGMHSWRYELFAWPDVQVTDANNGGNMSPVQDIRAYNASQPTALTHETHSVRWVLVRDYLLPVVVLHRQKLALIAHPSCRSRVVAAGSVSMSRWRLSAYPAEAAR